MTRDALDVIQEAKEERESVYNYVVAGALWFHDREGTLLERKEAVRGLSERLEIDEDTAAKIVHEIVGDLVDPIVQVRAGGERYVGVIEYREFEGAYGYLDYDDARDELRRVVCAQCVKEEDVDADVTRAEEHSGSFDSASYEDLYSAIRGHYEDSHDVVPSEVETGASLLTGTTIGGNTAWHAGNDGSGSGLDADTVDGTEGTALQTGISTANTYTSDSSLTAGELAVIDTQQLSLTAFSPTEGDALAFKDRVSNKTPTFVTSLAQFEGGSVDTMVVDANDGGYAEIVASANDWWLKAFNGCDISTVDDIFYWLSYLEGNWTGDGNSNITLTKESNHISWQTEDSVGSENWGGEGGFYSQQIDFSPIDTLWLDFSTNDEGAADGTYQVEIQLGDTGVANDTGVTTVLETNRDLSRALRSYDVSGINSTERIRLYAYAEYTGGVGGNLYRAGVNITDEYSDL